MQASRAATDADVPADRRAEDVFSRLVSYIREFEANLRAEINPRGAAEEDVLRQFLDASARILQIRHLVGAMINRYEEDPLLVPEIAAEVRAIVAEVGASGERGSSAAQHDRPDTLLEGVSLE